MNAPLSSTERRGKSLLIATIVIALLIDGIVILLKITKLGLTPGFGSIGRWVLTAALFSVVWRGQPWARWLLVGLNGLALLISIPVVVRTLHPLAITVTLQFVITIVLLSFSSSVTAFLKFQQNHYDEYAT